MYKNKDYHKEYYEKNKEKYKNIIKIINRHDGNMEKTITKIIILVIKKGQMITKRSIRKIIKKNLMNIIRIIIKITMLKIKINIVIITMKKKRKK